MSGRPYTTHTNSTHTHTHTHTDSLLGVKGMGAIHGHVEHWPKNVKRKLKRTQKTKGSTRECSETVPFPFMSIVDDPSHV